MGRTHKLAVCLGLGLALLGCDDEKPPQPPAKPAAVAGDQTASQSPTFDPKTDAFVLTFAGDKGSFADASQLDKVPDPSRGMVRVKLVGGAQAPAGKVWVANLRSANGEGQFALATVARDDFEELALGQGLSSTAVLPEGLEPPEQVAAPTGTVIVYKTSWCGVCKKVESYLDNKGVQYETKDVEKDRAAAAALQAKAAATGTPWKGSVPVVEIGDTLVVGFNRAKLEKLL